jgi:hypothetical protein
MRIVRGDVCRSPDPLICEEDVEVMGAVKSGASLRVSGNITVYGNVEDASIEADGSVRVEGGFLGTGGGQVLCGGGFRARFVQAQRVVAGENVEIESAIVSSAVFASGDVRVVGPQGSIVGGEIHAFGTVQAAILGSQRPVTTRIEVGVDPLMTLRIEELEREAMDLTKKRIGFLKDAATLSKVKASEKGTDVMVDMQAAAEAIQGDIIAAGEEIIELRKRARLNEAATVVATGATYPPLEVSICFSRLTNDNVTGPLVFRILDDRIILDTWSLE